MGIGGVVTIKICRFLYIDIPFLIIRQSHLSLILYWESLYTEHGYNKRGHGFYSRSSVLVLVVLVPSSPWMPVWTKPSTKARWTSWRSLVSCVHVDLRWYRLWWASGSCMSFNAASYVFSCRICNVWSFILFILYLISSAAAKPSVWMIARE